MSLWSWVSIKGQGHSLTLVKGHSDYKLKLVFLKNSWAIWNQSWNQLIDDLETWYLALSVQVLPRLFKLWPWVELDPFYAKVKFDHVGFYMGKIKIYFLETIAALGLKLREAFS